MLLSYIFGLVISYLIGSIPFGYIIAITKGIDIREHGSGNIGATNVSRILGRKYGILIFVLDLIKGFMVVFLIPVFVSDIKFPTTSDSLLVVLCGACAIFGHVFPLYLKFKGGKAVATSVGVFLWLSPVPVAMALCVWVITMLVSRYVSAGSIMGTLAFVGGIIGFENDPFGNGIYLTTISITAAILIILRHITNIKRIIEGTETKVFSK
ncbi:MAG: glycerol-3-phosphate 1-O-acyltransferase PlsY [Candidatus Scalinduaceae bacterium]